MFHVGGVGGGGWWVGRVLESDPERSRGGGGLCSASTV